MHTWSAISDRFYINRHTPTLASVQTQTLTEITVKSGSMAGTKTRDTKGNEACRAPQIDFVAHTTKNGLGDPQAHCQATSEKKKVLAFTPPRP